ncbi:hypothetical protein C8J57DRAFT_1581256 [Mycena rebaudengoi]|nr:hypothetical protein C8J57DRAFT_1581256 [Mycena rebaudengoi]
MSMLHPSLRQSSLLRLPRSLQPLAQSAAKVDGSLEDLRQLYKSIPEPPGPQAALLLPVVWANLDPSGVPKTEEIDSIILSAIPHRRIAGAILSLETLSNIGRKNLIPRAAHSHLWLRAWQWIRFLQTYWHCLENSRIFNELWMYVQMSGVIFTLGYDEGTVNLIRATPGVRTVLTRAWVLGVSIGDTGEGTLGAIGQYIRVMVTDVCQAAHFAEFVEGAGGTTSDLASLLVDHILLAVRSPPSQITEAFLAGAITFLHFTHEPEGPFTTADLISHRMIDALLKAIHVLVLPALHHISSSTLKVSLTLLVGLLCHPPGYTWIRDALRSGLLRAVISCPAQDKTCRRLIEHVLQVLLPGGLMYYHVVKQINQELQAVTELAAAPVFVASPIFSDWQNLVTLAEARGAILKDYEIEHPPAMRACDRSECGQIFHRNRVRACSSCLSIYCSVECQMLDWRNGHRERCMRLKSTRLRRPVLLSARERSFMRVLFHAHFRMHRPTVSLFQIEWMYAHPGEPFYTLFDYTEPSGVCIEVLPHSQFPADELDIEWPDIVSRVAKSRGRMDIHVMCVTKGDKKRYMLVPLRSNSSRMHDGLRRIVREIPAGTDIMADDYQSQLLDKIRRFIKANDFLVMEIH